MTVYLDHAASSPMPAAVREAYLDALALVGNPASLHSHGQAVRAALEDGRERIAAALGADAVEVVLTGGGTEAVNLGIKGLYWARNAGAARPRVLVPDGEHHATTESVDWLVQAEGAVLERIPVDAEGRIRLDALEAALARDPASIALVTALWANNEVGTVQPVARIVELAHAAGVPVHLDAIAAFGYLPIDVHAVGAEAVSVSAHKVGGPVGVGALVVARGARVEPLLHGGSQQRARSGTQDAAGAVAFGLAATLATASLAEHADRLARLRDRLVAGMLSAVPGAVLRGAPPGPERLPGNAHVTIEGCESDSLLYLLDLAGYSVSAGSACQAGVARPSDVVLALGVPEELARGSLRITLGPETTEAEVDGFLAVLPDAVARARAAGLAAREPALGR